MLRTEAYTFSDGLMIVVSTNCDGTRHAGKPCRRETAVTVVHSENIERMGVPGAMLEALIALFVEHPSMGEMIMC